MIEETENVQKLTDEELDQVAGGNRWDNKKIGEALLKNEVLKKALTDSGINLDTYFKSGRLTEEQNKIITGILSSKLGLNVTLNNYGYTKDANGEIMMSVDTIVDAIKAYKG